jgi:hypothetical protein
MGKGIKLSYPGNGQPENSTDAHLNPFLLQVMLFGAEKGGGPGWKGK